MNHHSGNRHVRMLLFGLLYGLGQRLRGGHKGGSTVQAVGEVSGGRRDGSKENKNAKGKL